MTCGCAQIQRLSGLWYSAEYSTFSISDEAGKYQLSVSGYSGDAGDAFAGHTTDDRYNNDGMMFTTPDSDNDACPCNCAEERNNGWWYHYCSVSALNFDVGNFDGNGIWQISSVVHEVQASRMLVMYN